jgi:hypothetical protein
MQDSDDSSPRGCSALFDNFYSGKSFEKSSSETFKFNTKTRQKFLNNDQYYPECLYQEVFNSNDIQQKMLDWQVSIFKNENLHWFHNSSSEPLDLSNPRIEITLDQLIGRKGFEHRKASF